MAPYPSNVHSRNQAVDVHEQYYWCPVPIVILASVGQGETCQKGIGREDERLETGLVGMI